MSRSVVLMFLFNLIFSYSYTQKPAPKATKQYPNLKAVLVLGPQEDITKDQMERMDNIADVFTKYGVKVCKFYNKEAVWNNIKNETADAHFLVYCGHGTALGRNNTVGGLVLTEMISVDKMLKELKFINHPVIIFQSVCLGAGSSAGDESDIGINEAERRVTNYSLPFFEMGASAYFANNTCGACGKFVDYFFQGKPLQVCYGLTTDTVSYMFGFKITHNSVKSKIEINKAFQPINDLTISICSEKNDQIVTRTTYINGKKKVEQVPSFKEYNAAYVGKMGFTIKDMLECTSKVDDKKK